MRRISTPQMLAVTVMILIAAFSRLLTNYFHIWNFTPIIAMALFSGAQIRDKRLAFLIPLVAMIITDAFLGFYTGILVVYAALMIITAFGFLLQLPGKKQSVTNSETIDVPSTQKTYENGIRVIQVFLATLGSSLIFFLVTNFALLYPTVLYPHTWQGIISSYTAGLPFFKNAIAGDLIYSAILFGSFALLKSRFPRLATN